jgi:hypothetical protein
MKIRLFYILLPLFVVLVAPACGGDDKITESGAEFLEEWGTALCEAGTDCGNFPRGDVDVCVDAFVQAACEVDPDFCAEKVTISTADWNDCLDASRDIDCDALDAGILPSECSTIEEFE